MLTLVPALLILALIAGFCFLLLYSDAVMDPPLAESTDAAKMYPALQNDGVHSVTPEEVQEARDWVKHRLNISSELPVGLAGDNVVHKDGMVKGYIGLKVKPDEDWVTSKESGIPFTWDTAKGRVSLGEDRVRLTDRHEIRQRILEMVSVHTVREKCPWANEVRVVKSSDVTNLVLAVGRGGQAEMWMAEGDLRNEIHQVSGRNYHLRGGAVAVPH